VVEPQGLEMNLEELQVQILRSVHTLLWVGGVVERGTLVLLSLVGLAVAVGMALLVLQALLVKGLLEVVALLCQAVVVVARVLLEMEAQV
jgi:hypothetical protein